MNATGLDAALARITFRDAVLLYPVAVALHVREEWPRFPRWARRFASPRYSDRAYGITHAFALALALGSALWLRCVAAPWLCFAFFALVFGPGVLWNAAFHAGASVVSRRACPGVWTGLLLYLPLSALLISLAVRDGRIEPPTLALALGLAAVFHGLEVGHNVFHRW